MPIKLEKRCDVCKVIEQGDQTLVKRIYRSGKFRTGGESLQDIQDDYRDFFNYGSIVKHSNTHQQPRAADLKTGVLNKLARNETNRIAQQLIQHADVRQLVMKKGVKGIKSGKIKLKAADVLKAASDEMAYELKKKDQNIQVMEMVMKFASGQMTPIGGQDAETIDGGVVDGSLASTSSVAAGTPTNYYPGI